MRRGRIPRFRRLLLESGSSRSRISASTAPPVFDPVVRFVNDSGGRRVKRRQAHLHELRIYESLIYENRSPRSAAYVGRHPGAFEGRADRP